MDYLKAFLVGGALCLIGQILIDKTKLTPARILVSYVVIGVILSGLNLYQGLVDFAGAGATVPLTGFGNVLVQAMAVGAIKDLTEGRQVVKNSFDITRYEPENSDVWDAAYEKFCKLQ